MNVTETNASALAVARMRKIKNALTAILCGAVPAAVLGKLFPTSPVHWLFGFVVVLVWANVFEYCYHRYLLHFPSNYLGLVHQFHHAWIVTHLDREHQTLRAPPTL